MLTEVKPGKEDRKTGWGALCSYVSPEPCMTSNKNVNIMLKLFMQLKNKSDCIKEFYGMIVYKSVHMLENNQFNCMLI